MRHSDVVWATIFGVGFLYEGVTYFRRQGETLSPTAHRLFRAHTPHGRRVWQASWVAFALWFLFHIPAQQAPTWSKHVRDRTAP